MGREAPSGSHLLGGLSDAQAEVVTTPAAPLAVLAGPGAGKTRVLTRRIAWRCREGDADADHTLVLTFSRRAADELLGRLRSLGLPTGPRHGGVTAGTFHSVAWAELARHRAGRGQAPPVLVPRPGRLLGPALAGALGRDCRPGELAALTDELGRARARGVTAATYADGAPPGPRHGGLTAEVGALAWTAYDRSKRAHGVMDLDDLLDGCAALLEDDADARAASRWRHRHVFVDEYQDLNPAHLRLLRAWVGDRPDACVVGDPDQAVYGFNGACPDLFGRVALDWPGIRILSLTEDFRSTPEIVAVTEAIRPAAAGPWAAPAGAQAPAPPAGAGGAAVGRRSRRWPGPIPHLRAFADGRAEAEAIATAVLGHHGPGRGWAQTAVLARTNARLRVVAGALDRAGVPWRLRDTRALADRPLPREWLQTVPAAAPAADLAETVRAAPASPDARLTLTALAEYGRVAPLGTVAGFRTWLDASGFAGEDPVGIGVDLATFHRAKGLEWPYVWVAGVEEGAVPMSAAHSPAEIAEEQRLLYVAVSRAADELTVSWAGSAPSRWIAALAGVTDALGSRPSAGDQRRRLASLRGGLTTESPATRRRRAALESWRAARARAARVPPGVILSDAVLDALTGCDPASADDVVRAAPFAGTRLATWAPELVDVLAAPA